MIYAIVSRADHITSLNNILVENEHLLSVFRHDELDKSPEIFTSFHLRRKRVFFSHYSLRV